MEIEALIIISAISACGLLVGMRIEKALLEDKVERPKSKGDEKEKGKT